MDVVVGVVGGEEDRIAAACKARIVRRDRVIRPVVDRVALPDILQLGLDLTLPAEIGDGILVEGVYRGRIQRWNQVVTSGNWPPASGLALYCALTCWWSTAFDRA